MRSVVWAGDFPITQEWGCTSLVVEPYWPACPSKHFHCGLDIGMPIGTALKAARGGIVGHVGNGILILKTGRVSEFADCYLHIDRSLVVLGQFVNADELIAYSGNKVPSGGRTTGPHLHFEVQAGPLNDPGTSLDPKIVLQGVDMTPEEHDHLAAEAARQYWMLGGQGNLSTIKLSDGRPVSVTAIPGAPTLPQILERLDEVKAEIADLKVAAPAPAGPAPAPATGALEDLARQVFSGAPDPVAKAIRYGVMNQAQASEYFRLTLNNHAAAVAAGANSFSDFFGNLLSI